MNLRKKLFLFFLIGSVTGFSQNRHPDALIPDNIADPSVAFYRDTFYLYATSDVDHGLDRSGPPVVWKSTDFVHWRFSGYLTQDVNCEKAYHWTDASGKEKTGYYRFWAPSHPVYKDGRYYLYATVVMPDDKMGGYLFTSETPNGPFHLLNGKHIDFQSPSDSSKAIPVFDDIDGEPFVNGDGHGYMYYRRRLAFQLSDDFKHLKGDTIHIMTHRSGYSEGPFLFERNGIFYYFYTLSGNQDYAYAYMLSRKGPLGPFEQPEGQDVILQTSLKNSLWGPGHGNVFQVPGKDEYVFVYLEYGEGGTTRQVYADRLSFAPDGRILPLDPGSSPVGNLAIHSYKNAESALSPSRVLASSVLSPKLIKLTARNWPEANNPIVINEVNRTLDFWPEQAVDGYNNTLWRAAENDPEPSFTVDLGSVKRVDELEAYLYHPTLGHSWIVEKSADAETWSKVGSADHEVASPLVLNHIGRCRFLRIRFLNGDAGIWEFRILQHK